MERLLRIVPEREWCRRNEVGVCQRPGCGRSFTLLSRPANCHACGMVMCAQCLKRRLTLPGRPGSAPVPLCHACAIGVSNAQAEAERAYQQRGQLLQRLEEQQAELERLLALSASLREENQRLVELTEALAAGAPSPAAPPQAAVEGASGGEQSGRVDDGGAAGDGAPAATAGGARTATAEETALTEELQAKHNALSRREAALQEATKKVAGDAARVAAQRTQLQQEERRLRAQFAQEFQAIIGEECLRLQNVYMEELTGLGDQFAAWRRDAHDVLEAVRLQHKHSDGDAVPAHSAQLAQAEEALAQARASHREDLLRAKKRFDDDSFVLGSALGVAQREVEAEKRRLAAAQHTVDGLALTLQEQQQRHDAACTEWGERLAILHSLHGSWRQQLLLQPSPSAAAAAAAAAHQGETTDHAAAAARAMLSGWRCVAAALLSQHGASLSALMLVAREACGLAEFPPSPPPAEQKPVAKAAAASDAGEHAGDLVKLRRELSSARRLSRGFEARANAHAVEVVSLKRSLALKTEELQELRARLSRTAKALVRASRIEKHVSRQLQQRHEEEEPLSADQDNGGASAIRFAAGMVHHGSLYMDGCMSLLSAALLRRYAAGVQGMQEEWAKRRDLTRRNTVALEETTASMKALQEDLRRREAAAARLEGALRAREREARLRLSRLLKVSVALRTVASRLRAVSTSEEAGSSLDGGAS
ncbi:uncharacterized protein Tco025E_07179 [Trypanosoma conorhini]|uniref:FYVE-type domain-containing protein n=1 Tax=Trypanosoma conorhini TaxID=83891 RepID=A0A3R7KRS6_9TRYP|nr:uncharacterized protein Tco025E_07179 [Trypanosoma conorhini]RNF08413.1 hypothetical protein Tco025E_07179 [Trypanosoma conorhini]